MNPKGVTTKGLWITVFVKALPNVRHNICISNAQYSQLSAQQNLWCEIFEF